MYINREKTIKFSIIGLVFVFCFAIVALILNGINQFKAGSQLATVNQVSHLSHLLVRQQANLFSLILMKNARHEEINEALEHFAKEDFVIDASLYSTNGTLIAQSSNALSFKASELAQINTTQQIVEPIFIQQELSGFLRVTFNAEYGQTTRNKINALFHLLYGELLILFLAGGLFVSCFYIFRRKNIHIVYHNRKIQRATEKKQTQRFHSRRRAFMRK
ncbi:YtjB family periplasmic protein [Bibersteinia trehalosi]|uniref:Hemolysin regulation protein AhpA n=1 Tax=Bibersteinia trehalosi TaxID=47735 RepID=A0A3R8LAP1_BIBTR|nr:YtjB family periplasmic protein [Bibersteinia trehalosi]RRN01584.1 hemolysin regulation protein AhpA [Bibersteinia trehalosi]